MKKMTTEARLLPTRGCPGCAMLITAINKFRAAQKNTYKHADAESNVFARYAAKETVAEKELDRVIAGIQFVEEIRN